jgi:hypothetical protein
VSRHEQDRVPTGNFLGDMTDELVKNYGAESYITEFASGGPKNYGFKVVNPTTGKESAEIKVRGFTVNSQTVAMLNFENLKEMVRHFVSTKGQIQYDEDETNYTRKQYAADQITRDISLPSFKRRKDRSVVVENLCKKYKVVYDKRIVLDDFSTVPYGWGFEQCTD